MQQVTRNTSHLTIGLDLGDSTSEVCVLGPERQTLEQGKLLTDPESFRDFFGRYRGATVVFEVGSQSRWVQPLARKVGLKAIAADPRQMKLITDSCKKTDRRDAYVLARAGQGMPELLCPVEHRSEQVHADLSLMRTRELLVDQRTQMVNRIRSLVKASGNKLRAGTAAYFFRQARDQVPSHLETACAPLFAVLEAIHSQLLKIKRQAEKMARERYPVVERLMAIPGVGLKTALTYVLTLEDPRRILSTRNVGAYLGLTPRKKESGDRTPQLGITKAGDKRLRRLLILCAHQLLGPFGKDCRLRRWGLSLVERGGVNAKKRAVVAVARKLAIHMLAIWKSGQDYDAWRGVPKALRPEAA